MPCICHHPHQASTHDIPFWMLKLRAKASTSTNVAQYFCIVSVRGICLSPAQIYIWASFIFCNPALMVLPDHGCFMSWYILPAATPSSINGLYFSEADRGPCAFLCLYPSTFSVQADLSTVKVIASMMNPSTLCDMSMPDHKLYGTLDIPCSNCMALLIFHVLPLVWAPVNLGQQNTRHLKNFIYQINLGQWH